MYVIIYYMRETLKKSIIIKNEVLFFKKINMSPLMIMIICLIGYLAGKEDE